MQGGSTMRPFISIFAAYLVILGGLTPAARAQYGQPRRPGANPSGTGLPPTPSYDPSGGSSLSGGLKLDRFGRVATPGKDNDLMRQPLYPGASVAIMGHPLAPDRSRDRYGRQHQPGSPVGQPVLPRCQQERADDREEEERREGVRGIPPLPYHATTHWYSGGSPPRITSKATSWEGK